MWDLSLDKELMNIIPEERFFRDESMYKHTTFRVGGPASRYVSVSTEEELVGLMKMCETHGVEPLFIGNGSNLLVSDNGLDGLVIELGHDMKDIAVSDEEVVASAGALLSMVASQAYKHELTGLEFAAGIPGTIGGAMVMNAGAYGGEMKDVVKSVRVYNPSTGQVENIAGEDMEFSYRHSIVREKKLVVLAVTLKLKRGNSDDIKNVMDELAAKRRDKQPLEYPSAGSTFKRPEGFFAGKLIQDSGLMGYSVGGAQVSEKHAGFVVNKDSATALDIYRLIREVQEQVYADTGVRLEPEVIMLGQF